jgi:uncharacterized protein
MTSFVLKALDARGVERSFLYNNMSSQLTDASTGRSLVSKTGDHPYVPAKPPGGKDALIRTLKIQLGLSCNYSCEYCSQRFVPHADATGPYSVDHFMSRLTWSVTLADDAEVEIWGGEPLVYWKTLVPLVEALRMRYPALTLKMITNGSLLDANKVSWLVTNGFHIGLSHDGPGQKVRGPDPLDDPQTREAILSLYRRLAPLGRMSFNTMLHKDNRSRAAAQEFFIKLTGDENVPIGEGMLIDAYDEGGKGMSMLDLHAHIAYRQQSFDELRTGRALNFTSVAEKIHDFARSIETSRPGLSVGQKCGSDRSDVVTTTLNGDVLTCQNVSAVSVAPNGKPHRAGSIESIDAVKLESSRHWSTRSNCSSCPVVQLCKGSCMFLEDDLWDVTCESAYSDNVVFLATALFELTGCTLKTIEPMTGHLPEHRRNVFGPITTKRTTTRNPIWIKPQ